jgi:hypothetical protein
MPRLWASSVEYVGSLCRADPFLFFAARLFRSGTAARRGFGDLQFFQEDLERAKAGDGRLQEVQSDEGGKPKPVWAVKFCQQKAGENKRAGKKSNAAFQIQSGHSGFCFIFPAHAG